LTLWNHLRRQYHTIKSCILILNGYNEEREKKIIRNKKKQKQKGNDNMTVDFPIFVQAFRNWGPSMYNDLYKQTY
jgi:hypothetical protein